MVLNDINPSNIGNLPEVEKQWAVKALEHAETYFKLLTQVRPSTITLTRKHFSEMDIKQLSPNSINADASIKEKWRNFIMQYEKLITDYNFGTLLRLNAFEEYTEQNTYFVTRTVFYAIEVARNKEGINDLLYDRYQLNPKEES